MKSETMEYQTARDLPFAKAGTKVGLSLSEGCIPMSLYNIKDCEVTISKEFIGQLLCEGWIRSAESVKPREWWVNMHKGSGNNYFCETKDEAIRTMWGVPEYNHIIKVREVIG